MENLRMPASCSSASGRRAAGDLWRRGELGRCIGQLYGCNNLHLDVLLSGGSSPFDLVCASLLLFNVVVFRLPVVKTFTRTCPTGSVITMITFSAVSNFTG